MSAWNRVTGHVGEGSPVAFNFGGMNPASMLGNALQGAMGGMLQQVQPVVNQAAQAAQSQLQGLQGQLQNEIEQSKKQRIQLNSKLYALRKQMVDMHTPATPAPLSTRIHSFVENNVGTIGLLGAAVGVATIGIKVMAKKAIF